MDCCAFKHKIEGKVQTFPLKVYPLKTAYNQAFGASIFRCLRGITLRCKWFFNTFPRSSYNMKNLHHKPEKKSVDTERGVIAQSLVSVSYTHLAGARRVQRLSDDVQPARADPGQRPVAALCAQPV